MEIELQTPVGGYQKNMLQDAVENVGTVEVEFRDDIVILSCESTGDAQTVVDELEVLSDEMVSGIAKAGRMVSEEISEAI